MATKTKAPPKTEGQNPLEGYSTAIETLMWIAKNGRTHQIRMEAAQTLLNYTDAPPNANWNFEEDE